MMLTERQLEVAEYLWRGWPIKRIALHLMISTKRVNQIVGRIAVIWKLDPDGDFKAQIIRRVEREKLRRAG